MQYFCKKLQIKCKKFVNFFKIKIVKQTLKQNKPFEEKNQVL